MLLLRIVCVVAVLAAITSGCKFRQKADLLIHHAVIYTANQQFDVVEAMAITDGKIVATGTSDELLQQFESTENINAKGAPVYPGFIDAHCHFTGYATDMWKCNLTGTQSFDEVIQQMMRYAKQDKTYWLYGRGWDQNDWPNKAFPDKTLLDSLFPNRPVFLKRIDGHAALVNQKALDLAGINSSTVFKGGQALQKNGQLTGILIDNAMDVVENKIPLVADDLTKQYYMAAQDSCFQYGLTSVHDCGVSEHTITLVDEMQQTGKLFMKIYALLSDSLHYYKKWIEKGIYKTPGLHVGGFKMYADGALGSKGACLLADYTDQPGWKGFLLSDTSYFAQVAQMLANSPFQLCTHAIGDSGNRQILKTYARVLKGKNNRRWRIEHAQVVNPADFAFFAQYNIIPSVQPTHATSDMYWAEQRLGKNRLAGAYAYQQLLQQNGWLPLGTDFPVEDLSPLKTFFAAVARKDNKGWPENGFLPAQALSRKQALWGITLWPAMAAFEEKEKGSLEKGKAADFVLLNTDIMQCNINKVLEASVSAVFVNGKKVYQ
jgi:hypothetical protein